LRIANAVERFLLPALRDADNTLGAKAVTMKLTHYRKPPCLGAGRMAQRFVAVDGGGR
jgi:hypothetical protein